MACKNIAARLGWEARVAKILLLAFDGNHGPRMLEARKMSANSEVVGGLSCPRMLDVRKWSADVMITHQYPRIIIFLAICAL